MNNYFFLNIMLLNNFSIFNNKKLLDSSYFILNNKKVTSFLIKELSEICPKSINFFILNLKTKQLFINIVYEFFISFFIILKIFSNLKFDLLADMCAIDFPINNKRFSIFYNLISTKLNYRLFCYINIFENQSLPSITKVHNSANWLEREIWDLFGIFFTNHPDLRRILTDYGFDGFALRKDFPLTGYVEVLFDQEQNLIIYEPLELSQEYRFFDFETPWKCS